MAHRLVREQFDRLTALLLVAHEDGDLDEEELLVLLACCACGEDARNSILAPLQFVGRRICLDELDMDEEACIRRFRFNKNQVHELYEKLDVPTKFPSPIHVTLTGLEGLLVRKREKKQTKMTTPFRK